MNRLARILGLAAVLFLTAAAHAALTIEPLTWNVVGLDSNDPLAGPNDFPVGARVCSNVATTNVSVSFVWDSANPLINLRPGTASTIILPAIGAGQCADAYFEVEITKTPAAFDTSRDYHITATDFSGSVSTPPGREIYVEHLISQNRNSLSDVKYGTTLFNLVSVPAGGSMDLVVGNTYIIQVTGGTATQGYNQFEEFINFSNTIFQILDVDTTYSADNSPYVSNPSDKLYADACLWENDPNSPNYRSCVGGDFKAGGSTVVTTYTIKIIGGGGTTQTLNTLLYDFSGSSFHYNSDYSTGARIAAVSDPNLATIAKNFSPDPTPVNGVSTLTFALGNPNPGTLTGYSFVDNLPANLVVAATPNATTSGCGAATLTATAGSSTISFSGGAVAAGGTCVITVNVTPTATGTLVNTTNNLFVEGVDTGKTATDSLTANTEPPPPAPVCGLPLAAWRFPTGFNTTTPAPSTGAGTAAIGAGLTPLSSTNSTVGPADGTQSWGTNGNVTVGATLVTANNEYFEFAVNTTGLTGLTVSFDALKKTPNGPAGLAVYVGTTNTRPETGTSVFNNGSALPTQNTWVAFGPIAINSGFNPSGTTYVRIYTFNSGNTNAGSDLNLDNVVFLGCVTPVRPTMTKSFSPDPIAVGGVSTLTFTLTNTNAFALTGAAFTDTLPAGVVVAATPAAATTCGGAWAPTAGSGTLTYAAGTIPASGSCTVSVNVTATTGGAHSNVSGYLSTTETGQTTTSVASDVLTAIVPPAISKNFDPSPILPNQISTLTFIIENPNVDQGIGGVAFGDTFPAGVVVAPTPNATTSGCGSPTFAPAPGSGSVSFSSGTIAPGGTCVVTVDVTAASPGTYNNVSGPVSFVINAQTVNGNTASDTLQVDTPSPSISLLKQVGPSPTGPWSTFLATTAGQPVYYLFTIENTGDVALTSPQISDNTLNVSSCNATLSGSTLPAPVPANENHIVQCVVGPITAASGSHANTATVTANFGPTPVTSDSTTATYATTGLTLDKSASPATYTAAGDTITYSYLVTNSGFAPLVGPVTITDDKTTATCPAVSTVGDLDNFLDPGESITCTGSYIITATDVTNLFVTNTASASADGATSNTDSATVTLVGVTLADVSIVKTLVTAGPYFAGQSITYTLFVANAGPSTATNVQVTDTPTNLGITNVSGGGCVALPCTIPSLASGANTTITVTATITAAGAFDNSATVSATETDPNLTNNTDNTGNGGTATLSADVAVVKTLTTAGPYVHGQSITYNLAVTNNGPSTATNVQITDTPTNLSITGVSGAGCAALPCTIASLASGATANITVTATITAPGAFDNSVTVSATEPDPNTGNNTDNTGNGGTAAASADISVVKTLDTAGPYTHGQTVTYTLLIANAGPSTATNIQVTDTPTNLTITGVSGACVALPCTIASLASGANTSITVTATISAPGAFDNSATVLATESDPNTANNTDNTGNNGTAAASADVSIVKTLTTTGPFIPGQSISYTLFIANAGPSTATNVQVTDTPTNLTITNVSGGGCAALPCTIASLASGANTTITVTATIDANGAFDNTASANADEPDPNSANNTDSTGNGGTAAASADVSIVKTLTTTGPYIPGQSVTYTLFVANAGPSTATNVQVTDTPTNLTITNVSGGGCAALPCTIASLASGANTTITVTATIVAAGAFDNSATVTATEPDPNTNNNTDSIGNGGTAAASADVSVVKTLVTTGPFTIGQTVNYTLDVANAGPSTATTIQVTDTPTNLTITSVSGGGCAALPCTIASLASGASVTINVSATINSVGAFDNSATATATEADPNLANNTDNTGNNGITGPSADVSMVKTLITSGPFIPGQSVSYTLFVANAGPSTATNIQVTDTPTNLTITSVSGGGCAALPCTISSLASGANTTVNVTATIVAAGAFDNSATATATEPDPNTNNNTDSTGNGGTATASADVSMVKTLITSGPFLPGQSVSFTLLVANAGPSTATNIQVTDTPTNLTVTSVSGSGCAALPCTIPSLASGANTTINVTATINAAGAFDNSATALAVESDPNTNNNTDPSGNGGTATASADLSMVKTLTTVGPFAPGQTVTFTLVVTNAGPSTATTVQITDTPSNLTITGVSGGGCAALPCTIASIASGASVTINVTATIIAAGAFDNSATAMAVESDPNLVNNTDPSGNGGTATAVAGTADMRVTKTASLGFVSVGQTFDYTLSVVNGGPATATNVVVTDTLPANFSLLSATSTQGTCSGTTLVTCTVGTMNSGATVTITIRGSLTQLGTTANVATVTASETDPVPANNTSTATVTAGSGIPTLSEYALLALALMLAMAGVLVRR